MQQMGFASLLGFVYVLNSRVFDLQLSYLHIPLILSILAGIGALVTGNLFSAFTNRVGVAYLLLTCCFVAGVPFAYWRGGSLATIRNDWMRALLIWAFVVGLTVTYRESKLLLNAIVLAVGTAAILGLATSEIGSDGRLGLAQGRLGNPNYFAFVLLVGLPFVWRLYSNGGRPGNVRRLIAAGLGVSILAAILKSGSRAALYSMAVMVFLMVLREPLIRKIQWGFGTAVVAILVFALLPSYLRQRYLVFTDAAVQQYEDSDTAGMAASAAGSTRQRQYLFQRSILIALQHPVFGVGLGNFSPFVFQENRDVGRPKEAYLGTHNTYTQLACEAGVPALLLFLVILGMSWRSLTRLIRATRNDKRPQARDIYCTALATQVCLGGLCVFLCFFHVAYDMLPHMLVAVALVVSTTGTRELKDLETRQPLPMAVKHVGNRVFGEHASIGQRAF
jgi:O-antigen ligase